jgi:serine protease Do
VPVTIAARPSEQQLAQGGEATVPSAVAAPVVPALSSLGMTVGPITTVARTRLRLAPTDAGVLILNVERDSKAADLGIRAGDAILSANGADIKSAEELDAAIATAKRAGRTRIGLFIQSQSGGGGFVPVPIADPTPPEAKAPAPKTPPKR